MTMSFYENMNQLCKVCGEPAAGFHFGAFTCEGCKSFFGRTCNNVSGISECKSGGRCEINKKNRTSCKQCRLKKCLAVGMSKSGSRYGRRSNWFKIHCLLTSQNQGNSEGAGMTMNNTTNKTNSSFDNSRKNTSAFQNNLNIGTNGMISTLSPTSTSSFTSGLSPESREQFLFSFGQKFNNPDLVDYFRSAGMAGSVGPGVLSPFMTKEDKGFSLDSDEKQKRSESFFDASNNKQRSARSSYSPKSDVSEEERNTPSSAAAPDNNNKDISKFDLFARDLMKMGYDPMRLWSTMLGVPPQNLGQLNPYGLMFPNAFPFGVLPPSSAADIPHVSHPSLMLGGAFNPSKFLSSGIGMQQELSTQNPKNVESDSESKPKNMQSGRDSVSPSSSRGSPMCLPKDRITPIIPSSPNLTHSPPINFYNLKASVDVPIDLSTKTTNNNYVGDHETKRFDRVNKTNSPVQSESDDDERVPFSHHRNQLIEHDISRRHHHIYNSHYDFQPQSLVKRKVERQSIDKDNDKVEREDEFTSNNNNNEVMKPGVKRRSSNSFDYDVVNPKREKVSSPLNLIRNLDSNIPKIVT